MTRPILNRILKKVGDLALLDKMAHRLSASEFHSFMLEVRQERANEISASQLFKNYQNNRFVKPATTPLRFMRQFDNMAFNLAAIFDFEEIELSPVAPFGNCAAVGTVHQNKVLSADRNTEVVADPTNLMALEASLRRRQLLQKNKKSKSQIHLCCSHRTVRTQALQDPSHFSHFRIFTCLSAGSDEGSFRFEINSLLLHFKFYLNLLSQKDSGFEFRNVNVFLTDLNSAAQKERMELAIFKPLKEEFPMIKFNFDDDRAGGRNYYQNWCFKINMTNSAGIEFPLIDGGFTDWTQQLLNNKKERLLISAIGSELACEHFYQKG